MEVRFMTSYAEAHRAAIAAQYNIPTTPQPLSEEEQEQEKKLSQLWTCKRCTQLAGEYQHGWIIRRKSDGDCEWEPGPNGRPRQIMDPCPVCSPKALANIARKKRQETLDKAFSGSNIPQRFAGWTFETYPHLSDQRAKSTMMRFVNRQLRGQNCIYLYGPKGYGKTGLAVSAAHVMMERQEQVLYMRSSDYFQRVREQKYSKVINGQSIDLMQLSWEVTLFILDEWGIEKATHETAMNFYNFIEERRNNPNLLTVITS